MSAAKSLMVFDLLPPAEARSNANDRLEGPDMEQAEPIADTLAILDRAASDSLRTYAMFWINRHRAVGNTIAVDARPDFKGGEERIWTYMVCDAQAMERSAYSDALRDHIRRLEGGREAVIAQLNREGSFHDYRPFDTAAEAVEAVLATGARLMIRPNGKVEFGPPVKGDWLGRDCDLGWPLKRAWQRFEATAHKQEAEIFNLIRQRGTETNGGWTVLEQECAA